jgi:hypothetical protein
VLFRLDIMVRPMNRLIHMLRPTTLSLLLIIILGQAGGCASNRARASGPDGKTLAQRVIFGYRWAGDIDKSGFAEPSGIVFHPGRRTLFVAGDEGALMEITTEGQVIQSKVISPGTDFEGITCDPATGLLYMVIEGEEAVVEVNPDSFAMLRRWSIPRRFADRLILKPGGQGLESLTFKPVPDSADRGVFFTANQAFSLHDPEDGSTLIRFTLPLSDPTPQGEATIRAVYPMPVIDLAGLQYDPVTDSLFACADSDNVILRIGCAGGIFSIQAFPGDNQEGLAWDDAGFMYIAQDSGGILKVRWLDRAP